ncbi:MAG: peptidylprolyl isomerase [Nitrospinae bacterium]|nr:peptidylprolyl isomerase [Nitrospinota bacterium]
MKTEDRRQKSEVRSKKQEARSRKTEYFYSVLCPLSSVICYLFSVFCLLSSANAMVVDKIAARVNGDIILMSEVKGRSFQILSSVQKKDKNIEADDISKIEKDVLNDMIEEKLMMQFAGDNNIKVSDEDVRMALEDIKRQNNFTDEILEEAIKRDNISIGDYKEILKEQIVISRIFNQEVKSKVHVDEKEIQKYYEGHRSEFTIPEEARVRHIMFIYNEETDSSKEEAVKNRAADVLNKIREGEDFARLASIYSEDPSSAKNGGDLGYFQRGKMIKVFEDTAFTLKKGEVGDVIRTPFGFHIIKCEDRKESGFKPLTEVSKEIENRIYAEKMKSIKTAWLKKLKDKAFIEILY